MKNRTALVAIVSSGAVAAGLVWFLVACQQSAFRLKQSERLNAKASAEYAPILKEKRARAAEVSKRLAEEGAVRMAELLRGKELAAEERRRKVEEEVQEATKAFMQNRVTANVTLRGIT